MRTRPPGSFEVFAPGLDVVRGGAPTLLASAAKASATTTVLRVSPHLTVAANTIAKDVIPAEVVITVAHSDTAAITYSVGVHFAA